VTGFHRLSSNASLREVLTGGSGQVPRPQFYAARAILARGRIRAILANRAGPVNGR
jgi:hypothetical protein